MTLQAWKNVPSAIELAFEGIDKSFFGSRVLSDVTLTLGAGRTLGLVGENGAGKSTLMNILGGNLRSEGGRMLLGGAPYAPRSPEDAARAGIAFIHQELNLFGNLSVAENLFLTSFPRRGPLIDRGALRRRARDLLEEVRLAVDPDLPLARLSAGERQLVEIAKALGADARMVILDEPTTSLAAPECERLFALLGELRRRGISMVYISHNLGDVLRLSDDIAVLRDGELVGQGPGGDFTLQRLVSLMVGRPLTQLYPRRAGTPSADPLLQVRGVSQPGVVREVGLTLHRGEILGLFGLMGSGRSELARIIFGLDPFARGEISVAGEPPRRPSPSGSLRRGVAFVTEDRRGDGLLFEASIAENVALVALREYAKGPIGWIAGRSLSDAVGRIAAAVGLSTRKPTPPLDGGWRSRRPRPSPPFSDSVRTLSGGNQQKVVLGKWLLGRPRAIILDEPTRGIDVGAKREIYSLVGELADGGAGVLFISSEIEELLGVADRILVMSEGEIRDEVRAGAFDRERLLRAALRRGAGETSAAEGSP